MKKFFADVPCRLVFILGILPLAVVFLSTSCREKVESNGSSTVSKKHQKIDEAHFVRAIIDEDNNTIFKALDQEINPNSKNRYGDTALTWAVFRDKMPLVKTLLKRGANPNIAGSYQKAPLHWAAEYNIVHQMEVLAEHGAKIDIYDKRFRTPLHFAVEKGHLEAARFLLEHGADPDWVNEANETPLYVAVKTNQPYVVELLVLAGANPRKVAAKGLSPLAYAVKTDRQRFFQTPAIKQAKIDLDSQIRKNIKTVEVNLDKRPKLRPKDFAQLLHKYTNQARANEGLAPLEYLPKLAEIATAHSRDMVKRKFFEHINPSGKNPLQRAQEAEFVPPVLPDGERVGFGIGENIYQSVVYRSRSANTSSGMRYVEYNWLSADELARQVVNGWMESPGHRKNILSSDFTHEGFGIKVNKFHIWVTQNFYFPMRLSEVIDGRDDKPEYHLEKIARDVHEAVNQLRVKHERPLLKWDEALATIAFSHGQDMSVRGFFEHTNPDGEDATGRATRIGYPRLKLRERGGMRKLGLGENLSKGKIYLERSVSTLGETRVFDYNWMSEKAIVTQAIEGWFNSPGHRANMLNRDYQQSGVAVVIDEEDRIFIVHNFF